MGSAEKKKKKFNSKKRNYPQLTDNDEILNTVEEENKQNKPTGKKKVKRGKENNVEVSKAVQSKIHDNSPKASGEKKRNKSKKKRIIEEKNSAPINEFDQHGAEDGDDADNSNDTSQVQEEIENSTRPGKSKKAKKKRKKDHDLLKESEGLAEKSTEADEDEVYLISSGDEDCSKGMKKWITEYHQSRPGLKVLQQRIDEFITDHEAKLEQERKEREARAAEGGWTVVVHHKGRKKNTDSESGIVVGSVAQAAVEEKMAKKKKNEVGLDFYRFQRREAQRNEIMMLQSKFEQDRKRIQQLRAARKFRPY
ncbi:Ribosomal RNA-processing protein 7 [Melia azedarach]|uniref:Ribosomal RNA-processing protein 7 n=1 Tax=Melia azedarach TaxID=155640 RepID=A0ACC1X7T1_MELAZ|nr:Ribosomal RNA-processing protein 7 [Melia azedarach]